MASPPRGDRLVEPRDAASVLVVDPAVRPWTVLMMRRPSAARFAAGAWAFPGGSVSTEDRTHPDPCRAAGVRELLEEMGLLLGRDLAEDSPERVRAGLERGLPLERAAAEHGVSPTPEALVYLARWVTPEASPIRFDCRFYLIRRPQGQDVTAHSGEVAEWRWMTPRQALEDPEVELIYVTRRLLEQVGAHADVEALIGLLRDRPETPPVLPRLIRGADGRVERVEDDAAPLPDPPGR